MTNVLDVAKYISQLYKQLFNEAIDEMKLHKLLYYSQRQCLTEFNKPLFNDNFEAWAYGPVIPIVRNNLQEIISNKEKINFEEKDLVKDIVLQYAPIDSFELSEMTHKETSWQNAHKGYGKYDRCNVAMSISDIKNDGINNKDNELFASGISNELKNVIDNAEIKLAQGEYEEFTF